MRARGWGKRRFCFGGRIGGRALTGAIGRAQAAKQGKKWGGEREREN